MYMKVVSLLVVFVFSVHAKRLPLVPYIKACHRSDPNFDQCALEHGREAIPSLVKGDKKYGIPVLTPLVLPSIVVSTDDQFQMSLEDVHLYNLDKADLKKAKFDLKNRKVSIQAYIDTLNIIGKYEVGGRILVLPIQGKGDGNVTAVGLDLTYSFDFTLEDRDGEEYIKLVNPKTDFTVKRAYMQLDNLFNGNEQLGASTNKVLNEEWEKVIDEMKPAISRVITEVANAIVTGVVAHIPYSEFFPE